MTTKTWSTLLFAGLFAAACSDNPTGPGGMTPLLARQAAHTIKSVPLKGRCETQITFLAPTPSQPPNVQRLHIDLVCQLSRLGRTTGTAEQTVTFTQTGSSIITNTAVYTAANGDQLFASFSGTGSLPDQNGTVTFTGTETYTGGTGRFADASGSATLTGSASLTTFTGSFETRGRLSY